MATNQFPSSAELIDALILALNALGGAGENQQILKQVIANLKLSESQVSQIHSGSRTELEYRLAWARTNAKRKGLIVSNGRNSWSLV